MSAHPEFVIVGQGLAGTALAWQLLRRGRKVLVVDRESGGCSRLAAGLITPITGKRVAKSWRWDELRPAAEAFYREIETRTRTAFFHPREAIRLFATANERSRYSGPGGEVAVRDDWFNAAFGGFVMPEAARLDVSCYLEASRAHFRAVGAFRTADLDPKQIEPNTSAVRIPQLDAEAQTLVFCRGFAPDGDPWFGAIPFRAAKGEFLTVRVPGLAEERVTHRGVWLAPLGDEVFRAGATYSWHQLDGVPTAAGRTELEARLRELLKLPFEVIEHRAAVRPIIGGSVPVLGRHPDCPRVAFFNGLGSKGSLLSPFFANQFAAHLCDGGEIDPEVDVRTFLNRVSSRHNPE
ncbi:FAD-binding oxidoreductase [Gemmata sp. JC717]|uniref:NAD(P)/FAD-dependent oxidoreductase n=1 Tax=Gemmata algarum TaxID=2975278 RepID=UPI0021BA6702|nr:FAD-binding oxidoreductase [Gemmata algarum]MDY3554209.1 FAD-binding oxidoreductase [Gemmata algarum]